MSKPTKQSYSFEIKLEFFTRYLEGESKADLAREFELSSLKVLETWASRYHNEGEDALRTKPLGRPRGSAPPNDGEESELQRLRREN